MVKIFGSFHQQKAETVSDYRYRVSLLWHDFIAHMEEEWTQEQIDSDEATKKILQSGAEAVSYTHLTLPTKA